MAKLDHDGAHLGNCVVEAAKEVEKVGAVLGSELASARCKEGGEEGSGILASNRVRVL